MNNQEVYSTPIYLNGDTPTLQDYTLSPEASAILEKYFHIKDNIQYARSLEGFYDDAQGRLDDTGLVEWLKRSLAFSPEDLSDNLYLSISLEDRNVLKKEALNVLEFIIDFFDECGYLNHTIWYKSFCPKELALFILSIVQWKKGARLLDRFGHSMVFQVLQPDYYWSAIYPEELIFEERDLRSEVHCLVNNIKVDPSRTFSAWSNIDGLYDGIIAIIPEDILDYHNAALWMRHTLNNYLLDNGVLVCVLPTSYLLQPEHTPNEGIRLLIEEKRIRAVVNLHKFTKDRFGIVFPEPSLVILSKSQNEEITMVDARDVYFTSDKAVLDYRLDWKKLLKIIAEKDSSHVSILSHSQLNEFKTLSPIFYLNHARFVEEYRNILPSCRKLEKIAWIDYYFANNWNKYSPWISPFIATTLHKDRVNICARNMFVSFETKQNCDFLISYFGEQRNAQSIDLFEASFTSGQVFRIRFKTYENEKILMNCINEIKKTGDKTSFLYEIYGDVCLDYDKFDVDVEDGVHWVNMLDLKKEDYKYEIAEIINNNIKEALKSKEKFDTWNELTEQFVSSRIDIDEYIKLCPKFESKNFFYIRLVNKYSDSLGDLPTKLLLFQLDSKHSLIIKVFSSEIVKAQLQFMGTEWKLFIKNLYIPIFSEDTVVPSIAGGISKVLVAPHVGKVRQNSSVGYFDIIVELDNGKSEILELGAVGKILFVSALVSEEDGIDLSINNKDWNLLEHVSNILYSKRKKIDLSVLFDSVSRTKRISDANKIIESKLGKNSLCKIIIESRPNEKKTLMNRNMTYAIVKIPSAIVEFSKEFNEDLEREWLLSLNNIDDDIYYQREKQNDSEDLYYEDDNNNDMLI